MSLKSPTVRRFQCFQARDAIASTPTPHTIIPTGEQLDCFVGRRSLIPNLSGSYNSGFILGIAPLGVHYPKDVLERLSHDSTELTLSLCGSGTDFEKTHRKVSIAGIAWTMGHRGKQAVVLALLRFTTADEQNAEENEGIDIPSLSLISPLFLPSPSKP
jgi:hypothetical protein